MRQEIKHCYRHNVELMTDISGSDASKALLPMGIQRVKDFEMEDGMEDGQHNDTYCSHQS